MLDSTDYCAELNKPIRIVNLLTRYLAKLPEEEEDEEEESDGNTQTQ
jgi:hypothetical protein